MDLIDSIDKKIGEVRTESLDLSVGEIITLHEQSELVIQPDFQRLFRWSYEQRSRLIESLLLELPIPSIFVIEKESGVLELIDGLQRISSLLHFISTNGVPTESAPLTLEGCDLVPELNGLKFDELPLTLRLRLKRTAIRTVIIKRQSSQFLRYEMFKRLNTGGSRLSEQDIRNVNARMMGDIGSNFYNTILNCANTPQFQATTELLPTNALETRQNEELVLRYFAAKNFRYGFKGNVSDWLDNYMEQVLIGGAQLTDNDISTFNEVFSTLADKFGQYAFVKYRNGSPVGGVAPAYFEAVTMGALNSLDQLRAMNPDDARRALASSVESEEFRKVTGPGANSLPKLEKRIQLIQTAFSEL